MPLALLMHPTPPRIQCGRQQQAPLPPSLPPTRLHFTLQTLALPPRYDAGDTNKFLFPAAFTVAALALGVSEFGEAYMKAGQLPYVLDNIK